MFNRTFQNATPYELEGQETGIVKLDMARFKKVMEAIANALYFVDSGKTFSGKWMIYSPSLTNTEMLVQGQADTVNETLRAMLSAVQFVDKPTPQPQVFKYGVWQENENGLIYRFQFYEGFFVNALTDARPLQNTTIVAV